MPANTELQANFDLTFWQIALPVGLTIILTAWVIFVFWTTRKKRQRSLANLQPKVYIPPDISAIKQKYIGFIDQVSSDYLAGQITDRLAHQRLSMLSRLFVYEIKGHRVDTFTLLDLRRSRYQELVPVVEDTYGPAFSELMTGDVLRVSNSAKEVIMAWN